MITDTFTGCLIMVGMAVGLFLSIVLFVYILYVLWRDWDK